MRKLWPYAIVLAVMYTSTAVMADGVNTAVEDPVVTATPGRGAAVTGGGSGPLVIADAAAGGVNLGGGQRVIGANAVGRNGGAADQVYGYDVDIAYDHVTVGVAIFAGLFLMTEWMERR